MAQDNLSRDPTLDLPYLTAGIPGIGGTIRTRIEDFAVEEVPLYEPADEGTHTFFAIEKRRIDTLAAVRAIAGALGRHPREIGIAGMKDARAVAVQNLSVEHVDPAAVLGLQLPGIRVLWARLHRNKLKLGHLAGNTFKIKVRDVDPAGRPDAEAILEILRRRGVPNYFGPQRFGVRGDTWRIGLAILKHDEKEAIDVMCGRPSPTDPPNVRRARELYEAGQYREAARLWPQSLREERVACKTLAGTKGSYRRALFAVDRSVKRLYVSAFQSWLFNQVVVERVRLNALDQLWPGDLAYIHDRGAVFLVEDTEKEQPRAERLEVSPSGPIFGTHTTPAQGRQGDIESAVLTAQAITPEDFRNVKGQKLRGARRPLRFPLRDLNLSADRDDLGDFFELRFFLPSGCYATSLLRELSKTDVHHGESEASAEEPAEEE